MKRFHYGCRLAVLILTPALMTQATAQSDRVETPLAPGVSYLLITRPGPLQIHVLKLDLSEATARPAVALGGDQLLQLAPLSAIAARQARSVAVAGGINGGPGILREDPYRGAPIGLVVAGGELVCDPWPAPRSAILFPAEGRPRIERLALRGSISGADAKPLRLGGLNRRRNPGELVLYTPRFNPATRNLDGGRQVVLGGVFGNGDKLTFGTPLKGTVVASVDGKVNVEIPADGAVVAGSGPAAAWLAARQLGEAVTFGFDPVPEVGAVSAAVGAGPRLVRDGKVSIEADDEKLGVVLTTGTQPRSAVGFNDAFLYLVAVDGRAAAHSVGMALPQLAQFLIELGCTQAMALDGGGSTTLFVRDRVVNQPSDGLERAIASAILITTTGRLSTAPLPNPLVTGSGVAPEPGATPVLLPGPGAANRPATRIIVSPSELTLAPGEARQLTVSGEAEDGQPTAVDATRLSYEVAPAQLGRVDEQGRFKAAKPGSGKITARLGEYAAVVQVKVTGEPDLPSITPKASGDIPTPVEPVQPGETVVPKNPSPPTPLAPLPNINPTRPA
ncbi:MAG: phosphodiester glycosidase family protein, partial [Armatimonadetes bacterium]|nr:phosphodiester glycosidase family protein [Armatimonadota bacterium]